MKKTTRKFREIADWDIIFYYEQAVIEYHKHYKHNIAQKYIKNLEALRIEIMKRMGW